MERMLCRSLIYLKDLARRREMEITPEVIKLRSGYMADSFIRGSHQLGTG